MRAKTMIVLFKALRHIVKVLANIERATTNLNEGGHLFLDTKLTDEIKSYEKLKK